MSFEELNFSNESISILKNSIKNAKEFLKQPVNSTSKKNAGLEGRYYVKSSLKQNSTKTIPKTNCSNLYSNFDETHIKKSSSKEESIREGCKFSSFYTYRESSNKNVSRFEESFIYNPKEVKLKAKSIIDKRCFLKKNENEIEDTEKKSSSYEKEKKIQEQAEIIYQLKDEIINLKEENAIIKLENAQMQKKMANDKNLEKENELMEPIKKELKKLQAKIFKLKTENKSLHELLSRSDFQCTESQISQRLKDMEEYFKLSQEQLSYANETLRNNTVEILNYRKHMKEIMEFQKKTFTEERQKDLNLSLQIRKNHKKIISLLNFIQGIFEIFEGIKTNQEIDIDAIFLKKVSFFIKNEDLKSESPIKPDEYLIFLQNTEETCTKIFETSENLAVLASEFYHQKYFNKFLLG